MFKSKHHYVFSNNPDALITDDFQAVSVISEHVTQDYVIKKGDTIFHFRYVDDSNMNATVMDIQAKLPKANVSAFNESLPINNDSVRILNISKSHSWSKALLELTDDSNVPEDKVENIKSFVMKMRIP